MVADGAADGDAVAKSLLWATGGFAERRAAQEKGERVAAGAECMRCAGLITY